MTSVTAAAAKKMSRGSFLKFFKPEGSLWAEYLDAVVKDHECYVLFYKILV